MFYLIFESKIVKIIHFLISRIWLTFFICLACITTAHSSTLSEFINQTIENNPQIQAAQSNLCAAKAREYASSQPLYNPEVSAEKQNAIENTELVGITQTFDWANKREARRNLGTTRVMIAQAELDNLRQQLASSILSALANYQANQRVVMLAKKRSALFQKFISISRKRYANGDIARVDLDLAQFALSEALAQQADAEVGMNQALQTLRSITGFNQMNWPSLPNSLPSLHKGNIDMESLVYQQPAFSVLNNQYQSAIARIKVAERDRYPDPTIGLQGGRQYESGEQRNLIGITVSIPLFVRNPYKAEVDAAHFDAMEADSKRADMIRQVRADIISSAERYQALFHAVQQWQRTSGRSLGNGMTLTTRLWQAGELTTTDYIVQVKQRIDTQIAGVELKGRAWQAWADWLKASGQIKTWFR